MAYSTIMVHIDMNSNPEASVELAAGLASTFTATLIGFATMGFPPPMVPGGSMPEGLSEAQRQDIGPKFARKRAWFETIAKRTHDRLEWRSKLGLPLEALALEARCADLVILGKESDSYSSVDIGAAIFKLGRPALFVPEHIRSLTPLHVVIGWKDTREARRALLDALPFLHEATRVSIVELCEPEQDEAARRNLEDVSKHLGRHRIRVEPAIVIPREGSGAEQLVRVVQDREADLLVTGAYGHSRLGEWALGGMTHDLLTSSPFCCLMSH
jgi:nucleotide-binding universal stress UspA family protein